jgi:hypothetical protein
MQTWTSKEQTEEDPIAYNVADFFFNSLGKTAAGGEETAAKMF